MNQQINLISLSLKEGHFHYRRNEPIFSLEPSPKVNYKATLKFTFIPFLILNTHFTEIIHQPISQQYLHQLLCFVV